MSVDVPAAVERMDGVIRRREREHVAALRAYLNEAHRRFQRDFRRLYPDALDEVRGLSRVFREARARALLTNLEASMDALRLGSHPSGVPRVMRDVITLGREEGPRQVASLLEQLEERPGALGLAATVNVEAVSAQVANSTQRLARYSTEAVERINQAVIDGLARGSGVREVSRDLKRAIIAPSSLRPGERIPTGKSGGLAFRAETIARTELVSSLEEARESAMRDADVNMVLWVATDDDRTCQYCAGRDGNVYRLRDVWLPAHPRCRCATAPVRGEWLNDGTIDTAAVARHQRETRRIYERAHGRNAAYATGPSPFEKAAGVTRKPKAAWTPLGGWA